MRLPPTGKLPLAAAGSRESTARERAEPPAESGNSPAMTNTLRLAGLAGFVLAACEVSSDDVRTVDATTPRDGANGVVRWTAGKGVNVRAEPRADSTKVGGLAEGAQLVIGCQIEGQSVQGNAIWDY